MDSPPSSGPELPRHATRFDPADEPSLARLRFETLAEPAVARFLECLRLKRTALVLSGGGGKGAYEAGCILALFDSGVRRLCSIAGTSVGALNAVLCHELLRTEDRRLVLETWSGMSRDKVLHTSILRICAVIVGKFFLALFLLPVALVARLLGSPGSSNWGNWHIPSRSLDFPRYRFFRFVLFSSAAYLPVPVTMWVFAHQSIHRFQDAIAVLAFAMGMLGVLALTRIGPALFLASNLPLEQMIRRFDIESIRKSEIPLYITVSSTLNRLAPTTYRLWPLTLPSLWSAINWPIYWKLSEATDSGEAIDLLLQSAALPEVFRAKRIRGQYFVDGGVADNTPILPVCDENPDTIVAIYLDRADERTPLKLSEMLRVWIVKRLRETQPRLPISDRICFDLWREWRVKLNQAVRYWNPEKIDWREPEKAGEIAAQFADGLEESVNPWWPSEFLAIAPSRDLGGFFRGTLNFRPDKARRLMTWGYEDTLRWISETSQNIFPALSK